jgi:hypothetical protein
MPANAEKIRVLIATTNGPVEVLLLTQEDAAIGRSVACIGGTTDTADIASSYNAFVARPTGIVESLFGHACYRLDVSGPIDTARAGSSACSLRMRFTPPAGSLRKATQRMP